MNNLEETDRKDLILRRKREAGYLRGQEKMRRRICLNDKKKFLQRNIVTWNGLKEEMIMTKNVIATKGKTG